MRTDRNPLQYQDETHTCPIDVDRERVGESDIGRTSLRGRYRPALFVVVAAVALLSSCGLFVVPERISETAIVAEPTQPMAYAEPTPAPIEPVPGEGIAMLKAAFERQRLASTAPRTAPVRSALTRLVAFDAAPFPYDGVVPGKGSFLDVHEKGRHGHRSARGSILWQEETFGDRRVLVHVPAGFDPSRPATIVVFFHGHGATLSRDVLGRQQVADQISASGTNTVLLAPQFAVDARDSSAGAFWQPGGFSRFLEEAAGRLAEMRGDPASARRFAGMPVVIVAYSGGFLPAAWSLKDIAATNRIRGVVLLDALYGELDTYADWAASTRAAFFVSAYTRSTKRGNGELEKRLAASGLDVRHDMPDDLSRGGVAILATPPEVNHADYVTHAWTALPLKDILSRLPDLRRDDGAIAVAVRAANTRRQSAEATVP